MSVFLSCSGLVAQDLIGADAAPEPDAGDGAAAADGVVDSGDGSDAADGVANADGVAGADSSWSDATAATDAPQGCDGDEHETSLGCVSCEAALELVASTIGSLVLNAKTCDKAIDCALAAVSVVPCYKRCAEPVSAKHVDTLSGQLKEVAKGDLCFCADKPPDCIDASLQKVGCLGGLCQFLP